MKKPTSAVEKINRAVIYAVFIIISFEIFGCAPPPPLAMNVVL